MEKRNNVQKLIAWIQIFFLSRENKWYPVKYISKEEARDKKEVFENTLIANFPSLHDGLLYGVRYHVVKTLIKQGLWKERDNIGILVISNEKAKPGSGLEDRDAHYKLYYL